MSEKREFYFSSDDVVDQVYKSNTVPIKLPPELSRVITQPGRWKFDVVENKFCFPEGKTPRVKVTAQMSASASDGLGEVRLLKDISMWDSKDLYGMRVTRISVCFFNTDVIMEITDGGLSKHINRIQAIHIDIMYEVEINLMWPTF